MKRWKLVSEFHPWIEYDMLRAGMIKAPLCRPRVRLYRWRWQAALMMEWDVLGGPFGVTLGYTVWRIEPVTNDNVVPFPRLAA